MPVHNRFYKTGFTPVDLVFGINSQLRAIAEVYASDDAQRKFARKGMREVGRRTRAPRSAYWM